MAEADQSSSQSSAAAGSADTSAAGGSQQTQSSQATTTDQTSQASSRPAYIPETFWDATAGKVKEAEFAEHYNSIAAKLAAQEVQQLSRPQTPADYKLELPAEFKAPAGAEFKIDPANPLWEQGRAWAQKHGLTQEAFSEAIALVAGDRIGTDQQVATARTAEIAKLGPAGPARVDALGTFFKAYLGDAEGQMFMSRMFTAADVQMAEKMVAKITSGGAASFTQRGREPPSAPGRVSDEAYAKMSPGERLSYAKSFPQTQFANGRG